jgi:hypothetical protein
VFDKSKNGQKKCPILENPGILLNSDFPKCEFTPECSYFQKTGKKWVTIKFYIFLVKKT